MLELHLIAHRQFPWQSDSGYGPIMRAFKVFGDAALGALISRELGMTMRQFLLLGAAVAGHFRRDWGMRQAICRACGHQAVLPAAQLLIRFGELYPLEFALDRLRCSRCNGAGVEAKLARLCDPGCPRQRR